GRYLGLASPEMLAFYKQQNINTLQLLPVAACMHEPHLLEMEKVNYWGYNPYLFMVPDPRYAEQDAVTELKTTIRELHKNGIEVILDVVYNHTAEGGEGPTIFNLKALDSCFYIKHGNHFANYTGCGNTVDLTYQPALNLVMDTLRYWVSEFKVDGFRFDLAATLGRQGDDYNPEAAFFKAVAQDPILRETKLIAEPWDIGPNGYQVG
ncbi:alpha-amylase family glycosyl hydrolase, partial [Vibrio parahaemolyticus]|nr:alpha-amylase family glycosyl hydrolase [Vibrio parahaemolyticus]